MTLTLTTHNTWATRYIPAPWPWPCFCFGHGLGIVVGSNTLRGHIQNYVVILDGGAEVFVPFADVRPRGKIVGYVGRRV